MSADVDLRLAASWLANVRATPYLRYETREHASTLLAALDRLAAAEARVKSQEFLAECANTPLMRDVRASLAAAEARAEELQGWVDRVSAESVRAANAAERAEALLVEWLGLGTLAAGGYGGDLRARTRAALAAVAPTEAKP